MFILISSVSLLSFLYYHRQRVKIIIEMQRFQGTTDALQMSLPNDMRYELDGQFPPKDQDICDISEDLKENILLVL